MDYIKPSVVAETFLTNAVAKSNLPAFQTSRSTLGKIAACWPPIFTFFALGYEHSVANMFIIPAGIFVGLPMLWMGRVAPERGAEAAPFGSVEPLPDAVEA
jgi:formate/nitrite transporter FocA (FNT family)